MMDDFAAADIDIGDATIFVRTGGSGPPDAIDAGHFFPEEAPYETADLLSRFLIGASNAA